MLAKWYADCFTHRNGLNAKDYLTSFASPLIIKLKLFIYLICTD